MLSGGRSVTATVTRKVPFPFRRKGRGRAAAVKLKTRRRASSSLRAEAWPGLPQPPRRDGAGISPPAPRCILYGQPYLPPLRTTGENLVWMREYGGRRG